MTTLAWRAALAIELGIAAVCGGQERTATTVVAPGIFVVGDSVGNLLLRVGQRQSQVVGIQAPELNRRARQLLDSLHASPVAYAVSAVTDSVTTYGDGGWGALGAITIGHENLRYMPHYRLVTPPGMPRRFNPQPILCFSEAMQLYIPGEDEIHLVHQKPGFSDADIIVHIEHANVIFLGSVLTSDGFPELTPRFGGTLSGLIGTIEYFYKYLPPTTKFVPARGPVIQRPELGEYLAMLTAIRDSVQALRNEGQTREQIMAAKPTRRFDAAYGHGAISGPAFAASVFDALVRETTGRGVAPR
jgi:cyclase